MKSYLLTLLLLLSIVFGQAVMAADEATETEDNDAVAESTIEPVEEDMVLIIVNGTPIKRSQIDEIVNPQLMMATQMGQEIPMDQITKFRQQVLQSLVGDTLIEDKIKEMNIVVTDEDVDNKLKEVAVRQQITVEELLKKAAEQGDDEATLRKTLKEELPFEKLLVTVADKDAFDITDEEAKEFYDENPDIFNVPASVKASHILAGGRDYDPSDEEQKKELRAKIERAQKELKDGKAFEDVAKELSDCPSSEQGGDLMDYFLEDGTVVGVDGASMDPIFTKATFALKVGEVSDIVESSFGFHIIKCTDRKEAEIVNFDEEKPKLKEYLKSRKKSEFAKQYVQQMIADADIVVPGAEEAAGEEVEIKPAAEEND